MPRQCPVYDHVTDFGGPRLAAKKLYPTKREFILALWEINDPQEGGYFLEAYDYDLPVKSGSCVTIEESEIQDAWVRGCVCDYGAGELLSSEDYAAGKRFHWEAGGKPSDGFIAMIACWQYGDWY